MTEQLVLEQDPALTVYTSVEAAGILRCSKSHVAELVKRGELKAIPGAGRRILISRRALEAFINGEAA